MRRSLNGCFVDFPMLPALLGKVRRRAGREAVQDCWADFLLREDFDDECQWLGSGVSSKDLALDAWRFANLCGLLDADGLTDEGRRLVAGEIDTVEALARGVRTQLVGQDGKSIVDLLLAGAATLAATDHAWARFCPGLLTLETIAIIYLACINGRKCDGLLNDLITWRDVAMHPHGPPDPLLSVEENALTHATAVFAFYSSHDWLAHRIPMNYGEEFATAKLLDFTGLLRAKRLGGNLICLVPPG